jgi:hypothetical protein
VPTLARAQEGPRVGRALPRPAPAIRACAFAGRCPWQPGKICEDVEPPWRRTAQDLAIRCHLPLDELQQWTKGTPVVPAAALPNPIDQSANKGMPR